jgi:hypothetical protein
MVHSDRDLLAASMVEDIHTYLPTLLFDTDLRQREGIEPTSDDWEWLGLCRGPVFLRVRPHATLD